VIELHPFQRDAVDRIEREISEERRRLLYVAPTGAGKTVVGAEIINRAVERHHRVLVIAHRREIITQTRDKLIANGVNPGIILAGFEDELRPYASVQVASIQTLHARAIRSNRMPMPAATIVIIDEAHHARARTYGAVLDKLAGRVTVEVTQNDSSAVISVADDGPGIPTNERQNVFKRFYRLERNRRTPGNGLGLSLVAAVARLHGAGVEMMDNAPGLKFRIRFPLAATS
jgi:hypothetical protein